MSTKSKLKSSRSNPSTPPPGLESQTPPSQVQTVPITFDPLLHATAITQDVLNQVDIKLNEQSNRLMTFMQQLVASNGGSNNSSTSTPASSSSAPINNINNNNTGSTNTNTAPSVNTSSSSARLPPIVSVPSIKVLPDQIKLDQLERYHSAIDNQFRASSVLEFLKPDLQSAITHYKRLHPSCTDDQLRTVAEQQSSALAGVVYHSFGSHLRRIEDEVKKLTTKVDKNLENLDKLDG
jgi:hypothetical protein